MNRQEMVESLRAEMARLQQVLDLLSEQAKLPEVRRAPGRPRKSVADSVSPAAEALTTSIRRMSPEGKARIAAAQRKRWADKKAGQSPFSKLTGTPSRTAKKVSRVKSATKAVSGKTAKSVGRPAKTAISSSTTVKTAAKKTAAKKKTTEASATTAIAPKQALKAATTPENQ